MTGADLKIMTESIVDETIDSTLFYQLLDLAKTKLEEDRLWSYLIKVDETQTKSASDTYLTMKTLPVDIAEDVRMFVGDDYTEYFPIPLEDRRIYKDSFGYYYIDWANLQFGLCGQETSSKTISLVYKRFTPTLTSDTEPVFPSRFHGLLAFITAGYYQGGVDADDVVARMSPENKAMYASLRSSMMRWDANIKNRTMNGRAGIRDNSSPNFNEFLARM